jgi:hypothetical protein
MEGFYFSAIDIEKFAHRSISYFISASLAGQRLDHAYA